MAISISMRFSTWPEYYAVKEKLAGLNIRPSTVKPRKFYKTVRFESGDQPVITTSPTSENPSNDHDE